MGCYHGTCGISQLPIMEGEHVVLYPLVKNIHQYKNGYFTSTHNSYEILSLGILGIYNGYGSIDTEKEETKLFIETLKFINQRGIIVNKDIDKEVSKAYINMLNEDSKSCPESFVNMINRKSFPNLSYMMIKESIYTDLVNLISQQKYFYTTAIWADKVNSDLEEYITIKNKYEDVIIGQHGKNPEEERMSVINLLRDMELSNVINSDLCKGYQFVLGDFLLDNSENKLLKLKVKEYIMLNESMDQLRKWWSPQNGAGSQSFDIDTYKLLSTSIDKAICDYMDDDM